MTAHDFQQAIKRAYFLDAHEMEAAGLRPSAVAKWADDPVKLLRRATAEDMAIIWPLIAGKQP